MDASVYHGVLFLLLGTLTKWTSVNGLMDYTMTKCAAGPSHLGKMNKDAEVELTLYYDLSFTCAGRVAQWEFFAVKKGTFWASVWRINHAKQEVRLLGKTKLTAEKEGYNSVSLEEDKRIPVHPGDVIGTHYESKNDDPVISWETDQKSRTKEARLAMLSTFKSMPSMRDKKLKIGRVLSKIDGTGKLILPALRATVYGYTDNLQIIDGPKDGTGRPEMFIDGVWGTICDKWFHRYGWPNVFCYETGYPGSKDAHYCNKMKKCDACVAADNVPIHFESPKTKVSLNKTMFQAWIHPNGQCQRDLDVCIECNPKIQLVGNKCTKMRGVPIIYEDGFWGTICDTKTPSEHMDEVEKSWTTAFCVQLGYDGVKKIDLAEEKIDDYESEYPVAIHNPVCGIVNPTRMAECPGTEPNEHCDHTNDFYITCYANGKHDDDDLDE